MSNRKQIVTRKGERYHSGYREFKVFDGAHSPSWERCGSGTAELYLDSGKPEDGERWLSVEVSEHGTKSGRSAMMTLGEPAARAVLGYLKQKFEGGFDSEEIEALVEFHRNMIEGARESGEHDEAKRREERIAELRALAKIAEAA